MPRGTPEEEARARRIAVTVAARAAARVVPVWWAWTLADNSARKRDLTALPILRTVLISSVAAVCPTDDIQRAVSAASGAAATAKVSASAASARAADAVGAHAAVAAANAAAYPTARAAAKAAITAGVGATWESARADIIALDDGRDPGACWAGKPLFGRYWHTITKTLRDDPAWGFWLWWYQGLLDGTGPAPDHPMLVEIALLDKDDEGIWEDEARALLKINAIWERYRIEQVIAENPLGLRVARKASGKLVSEPIEERDLSRVVEDIRRALREFIARCKRGKDGNALGLSILKEFQTPIQDLRRDVSRFQENPRELFRVLEETRRSLAMVAREHGFMREADVDRLLGNLQAREEDICVAAPEVLDEVRRRMAVRAQLFGAEQTIMMIRMSAGMVADSEGLLKAAMARAMLVVLAPDCSDAEKSAAWTFLLGAVPRGARLLHAEGEAGTAPAKDGSVMDTLVSVANKADKLDKGVDALQEAVAEGGPWVTEVYSQVMPGNFWGWGG